MRSLKEKIYHGLFEIGIFAKFALALVEVIAGIMLYVMSAAKVSAILYSITGDKLTEVPSDFFARTLAQELNNFLRTPQSFWAFLFLSHGIIKILLAGALLWWKKLWAYPLAAAIFTLFAIYQIYQMAYTPSASLAVITIFDIALIVLIVREYREEKTRRNLAR